MVAVLLLRGLLRGSWNTPLDFYSSDGFLARIAAHEGFASREAGIEIGVPNWQPCPDGSTRGCSGRGSVICNVVPLSPVETPDVGRVWASRSGILSTTRDSSSSLV